MGCGGSASEKRRTQALLRFKRRIGVVNSAHHDDVHPTLLDDLERDLTPASTVPASSAAVGHVNPLMFDLTVMDTASDTSEDSRRAVVHFPGV